jgi:hypothetical protein
VRGLSRRGVYQTQPLISQAVRRWYSRSKITRGEIIENLIEQIELSPDRLSANARKSKAKAGKK